MDKILQDADDRPTAVFACNDMLLAAIRAIRVYGLNIPDQISIVGNDDQSISAYNQLDDHRPGDVPGIGQFGHQQTG